MPFYHVDQIFMQFLIIGALWFSWVSPVRIKELRVPAVARHGAAVILDCDYTFDGPTDHEGLVVKWYLNDQSRPVYVWIPGGLSGPTGLGVLNGRLNLEYRVSEDATTEHRALHISKSAPDLAGDYTCVVSTFKGEDRKTKRMLVFVPEKNLRLRQGKSSDGSPSVICSAEGVYPEPEMTIRMIQQNITREMEGTPMLRSDCDNCLFDISVMAPLPEDFLGTPVEPPTVFTCELKVPLANNYTVRKEFVYYAGKASTKTTAILGLFLATLFSYFL